MQIEGVPVLVHPESLLLPDVNQSGAAYDTIFENGTLTVGPDEIYAVQTGESGPED
jgi:hypothetical protein